MLNLSSSERNRDDVTGPSLRDPVALNVGGELYSTTLDTLTRCRESMLGAMFTGQISLLRDRQGNVFIDRDGRLFRYVLNFLRSGSLDLPQGFSELALLRREADFYQIRPLLEEVRRYEEARPLCEGGGPLGAMLLAEVDCKVRILHFNLRRGPENYELCTCSVRVLTAELFCTWRAFLLLLCGRLSYWTPQGLSAPQLAEPRQNRVKLEWVPRPEELPQDQYNKLLYRGLVITDPETSQTHPGGPCDVISERRGPCEVTDTRSFVEELLTVSLAEGFRVESVTPDPADILNCSSLRLVRG